ncbi:MerR family transcriptional regulator [Streptomyces sp. NPDC001568]|uniref:MerR family transcriptional regulator n=1 Tax=Streptomyces sp. NPDC001568 TaxID=3364588 RepID=UPI00369435D8
MRIGDAAAAAGTTPRALRFYEQRGLLPPPARTAAGQREYGPKEVARVRVVRRLLALGLTVEDLRDRAHRLHLLDGDPQPSCGASAPASAPDTAPDTGTSAVVARRLAILDAEIARLTRLRESLARGAAPGGHPPAEGPRSTDGRATAPR